METNIGIFNRASGASNLDGENISSGMGGGEGEVSIGSGPMGESLNEAIEEQDINFINGKYKIIIYPEDEDEGLNKFFN